MVACGTVRGDSMNVGSLRLIFVSFLYMLSMIACMHGYLAVSFKLDFLDI